MTFQDRSQADVAASLSVAIQPSQCGRHLVRHVTPSEPFFYLGDTAWELFHRLDDKEAEWYLRNRAEKGFNSVMIVVLAEHGQLEYPDRRGEWPFFPAEGSEEGKYIPDLNRPNPGYFAFVDRVVALAASLGITISLVPTWGRYVNGGYYNGPVFFDAETAYTFGKFLGDRYPFHPFILGGDSVRYWNVETIGWLSLPPEERERTGPPKISDWGPVWEAMALGLIDGEKEGKRRVQVRDGLEEKAVKEYETVIAYHSSQCWFSGYPEATGSAQFPEATWLTIDGIQSGHFNAAAPELLANAPSASLDLNEKGPLKLWRGAASYEPIRKMYGTKRPDGRPRPVVDLEPHYEATHHWFNYDQPLWTADDIRNGALQGIFAGACGYTYGANSIWQMHNARSKTHPPITGITTAYTDWYLEVDLPGAYYAATIRRFFLSLPDYFTRQPDSSFILSGTNEPKDGSLAMDKLISGLRAKTWALVHLPYGGSVTIDLRKALQAGAEGYRAWWVDPKTGGRTSLDRGKVTNGVDEPQREFKSPTEGTLQTDWLLLLETFSLDDGLFED